MAVPHLHRVAAQGSDAFLAPDGGGEGQTFADAATHGERRGDHRGRGGSGPERGLNVHATRVCSTSHVDDVFPYVRICEDPTITVLFFRSLSYLLMFPLSCVLACFVFVPGWLSLDAAQMDVVDVQKYLVKWSGLSYQFCTWETREEVGLQKNKKAFSFI